MMSEVLLLDQILNLQVPVSEAGDADPSPAVSKVFCFLQGLTRLTVAPLRELRTLACLGGLRQDDV